MRCLQLLKYKRLKTRLFETLDADIPNSHSALLYVDVDIIVGYPIGPFLDHVLGDMRTRGCSIAAFPSTHRPRFHKEAELFHTGS
mmetsp:Transcript_13848/g.50441  ORF Transcript_13848/g.50441 Transcript_13848/m.50441 type:complete len:85 (+) Transcript_13848:177-431(+)